MCLSENNRLIGDKPAFKGFFFFPFFVFVLKASLIISTTCMFRTLQEHWVPHCTVLNLNPDSCSLLGSASSDVRLL